MSMNMTHISRLAFLSDALLLMSSLIEISCHHCLICMQHSNHDVLYRSEKVREWTHTEVSLELIMHPVLQRELGASSARTNTTSRNDDKYIITHSVMHAEMHVCLLRLWNLSQTAHFDLARLQDACEDVAMQSGSLGRSGTHELADLLAFAHILTRDIADQPK